MTRRGLQPRAAIRTIQLAAVVSVLCSCVASRTPRVGLGGQWEHARAGRPVAIESAGDDADLDPEPAASYPAHSPRPVARAEEAPPSEGFPAITTPPHESGNPPESIDPGECQPWHVAARAGGIDELLAYFRWPECSHLAGPSERAPFFDTSVGCYYGRSPYSRDSVLQEQRLSQDYPPESARAALVVLHATAARAIFVQYGLRASPMLGLTLFERVLIAELREGRWWIIAETDRAHLECLSDTDRRLVEATRVPPELLRCQRADRRCVSTCERYDHVVPFPDCIIGCDEPLRVCFDNTSLGRSCGAHLVC